jgi:hypothetical protein
MKLQLFNNGKGLIHGDDPKRIGCNVGGTLKIGTAEIKITHDEETVMPMLFNGASGKHNASFTSVAGCVYQLERVTVKGGRIVPPSQTSVELMELTGGHHFHTVMAETEETLDKVQAALKAAGYLAK